MLKAISKNLHINVVVCKKMPDIAIIMSIPFNCDWYELSLLNNNVCDSNIADGSTCSSNAALAFAVYEVIQDKLRGSPLELYKMRVSRVSCNSVDNMFTISWNAQGSLSILRKTIGTVLKSINPSKLFAKYSENMKILGGKVSHDVFDNSVNEMIEAIKKEIDILAIGRININNAKLNAITTNVYSKIPALKKHGKGDKPDKHKTTEYTFPILKTKGLDSVIVADYIQSQAVGVSVHVGDGIAIYSSQWPAKHKLLKDNSRIKGYVEKKYTKLGDEFTHILGYLAITGDLSNTNTLVKLIKSENKASTLVDIIKKIL